MAEAVAVVVARGVRLQLVVGMILDWFELVAAAAKIIITANTIKQNR